MSSKYGGLITARQRWSNESGVSWSRHALDRWDERTPACAASPERAWELGAIVPAWMYDPFTDAQAQVPDEVRVYHDTESERSYWVALIARQGVIRTVLDVSCMDAPVRGACNALSGGAE